MMTYGNIELGQKLAEAIALTSVDFLFLRLCGIHLKAISQPMFKLLTFIVT